MRVLTVIGLVLARNMLLLIELLALGLMAVGLTMKFDASIALIVVSVLLLADVFLTTERSRPRDR